MSAPLPAPAPLGRDEEALLQGVDVSREDKQNGYDVSLLALEPRHTQPQSLAGSHDSLYSSKFDNQDALPMHVLVYPHAAPADAEDESTPLAPSLPHTNASRGSHDSRRSHLVVLPVGGPPPCLAAEAYNARARAAEEKAARGNGRRALWERKGLLVGLVVLILLVCAGVGIGVGVGWGVLRRHNSDGDGAMANAAATSSAPHTISGSVDAYPTSNVPSQVIAPVVPTAAPAPASTEAGTTAAAWEDASPDATWAAAPDATWAAQLTSTWAAQPTATWLIDAGTTGVAGATATWNGASDGTWTDESTWASGSRRARRVRV